MKPHATDLVMCNIDWALLREQKEYCVNEAANNADCAHIYDGLTHLLDALQDAAVKDGFATFEQVFGAEE